MIKLLITTLLLSHLLLGYTVGSKLDKTTIQQLGLQENKLYLVNFFASWCKSCEKELPLLTKLYQEKVVTIVGVNVDKELSKGQAFVSKLNLPFHTLYDTNEKLISKFNPTGIPALYYIKNGKVLGMHIGLVDALESVIKKEIQGF
jgi:YD repeat-containing protein